MQTLLLPHSPVNPVRLKTSSSIFHFSVKIGIVTDQSLLNLQSVFPRTLVLAALDLIDRGNVLKIKGPARSHYDVLGSTTTYHVFINMPGPMSAYCTCPAFAYLVLSSETYLMCKHVLAVHLAHQMHRDVEQPVNSDGLASIITQEYS
ncbi:SWIM-type domain-containing protein [Mycena sanguinolenta]|uniref:SWIM-type domain-containing protein n=1 Tax=Mycena sanguinolenta TaxID=230812 RepID=A0A8H6ZBW9_9AGAR|nr:SWIM-type domain-containing protein [Mycena sanguinolenta]